MKRLVWSGAVVVSMICSSIQAMVPMWDFLRPGQKIQSSVEVQFMNEQLINSCRSYNSSTAFAKHLLDKGACPNALNFLETCNALHLAIDYRQPALVNLLIKYGALVNGRTVNGLTPLHIAVITEQSALCELLISKGALVNAQDSEGRTPLHLAAVQGNADLWSLLVLAGGLPNLFDRQRTTPLDIATQTMSRLIGSFPYHQGEKAELLLGMELRDDLFPINQNDQNMPALVRAAVTNLLICRALINRGAQVDAAAFSTGITPLIAAVDSGRYEISNLLIFQGADPNVRATNGITALMRAARKGHLEMCQLLLHAGADPNLATNNYGITPLMVAAEGGHRDMCALLIQFGARLEDQTTTGRTAYDFAVGTDN